MCSIKRAVVRNRAEENYQVALVTWFRLRFPDLKDYLTLGSFGENVGPKRMARLKKMGLTPGYPDLALFVPSKTYHGFMLELKTKHNKPSIHQKNIHELLTKQNYLVKTAYSFDEAQKMLIEYCGNLQS